MNTNPMLAIIVGLGALSVFTLVGVAIYVSIQTRKAKMLKPMLGVVSPNTKRGNKDA